MQTLTVIYSFSPACIVLTYRITQCFIPVPVFSSTPECRHLHWSSSQTLTPLTPSIYPTVHTFGAHTGQTHCWSPRCIWVAGTVSWPSESEEAVVSPFLSLLPTLRPLPPSPIHKHWESLSLSPALKKSSISQQLCDSGATNVLGVLQAMKSEMESPKDSGTRLAMPAALGRKGIGAPCTMGR